MRKVVFAINIGADGYCGHEGMVPSEESYHFFTTLLRNSSVLLFGRITYQLMVPYWPNIAKSQEESAPVNEFARVFDSLDKVVFTTTLTPAEGDNVRIVRANVAEEVLTLKQQAGKDIFIDSISIASQLSDLGLIDEYHFLVHPVVAGKGPRLFDNGKLQNILLLDLIGSETFKSGVVALHYRKRAEAK